MVKFLPPKLFLKAGDHWPSYTSHTKWISEFDPGWSTYIEAIRPGIKKLLSSSGSASPVTSHTTKPLISLISLLHGQWAWNTSWGVHSWPVMGARRVAARWNVTTTCNIAGILGLWEWTSFLIIFEGSRVCTAPFATYLKQKLQWQHLGRW